VIVVTSDITARKRADLQLTAALAERDALLQAGIADLRGVCLI